MMTMNDIEKNFSVEARKVLTARNKEIIALKKELAKANREITKLKNAKQVLLQQLYHNDTVLQSKMNYE